MALGSPPRSRYGCFSGEKAFKETEFIDLFGGAPWNVGAARRLASSLGVAPGAVRIMHDCD
ncbi:hypothetical protein G3T14_22330 [Methylobacterium sp. BTF04]|uniref:hypothetical protein n=1 Tax=Methylobacterium sp. BTF04 TaxID=2708300 RepID=UPI0013D20A75|nr:hypothetical protein [Methylobacterium sp. BTF04]NEU14814.1 hypothetical protein [Methylobacterium sp. BTF04]